MLIEVRPGPGQVGRQRRRHIDPPAAASAASPLPRGPAILPRG